MLEIRNDTPFAARLLPWLDASGIEHAIVVSKATYDVDPRFGIAVAAAQVDLQLGDAHHGEPGASSIRYASDIAPRKGGTDVALIACARSGRAETRVDVELRAGPLRRLVRVTGDRRWERSPVGLRASAPQPFVEMPLVWERAFGGPDRANAQKAGEAPAFDPRNPVGVGFARAENASVEGTPLPNLEDPAAPLEAPVGFVTPAGLGFVAPSWQPRARFAGTLDDAWKSSRAPLLPIDFDGRFFHAAASGLTSAQPFVGGEAVRARGVTEDGSVFGFDVPRTRLFAHVKLLGKWGHHAMTLDTIVVEPDLRRAMITHRVAVPCPRALLAIDKVRIDEAATW